jgi:GntR family transcriptional regulator, transcriptional repressor for pyruvate dehydrogenase complex
MSMYLRIMPVCHYLSLRFYPARRTHYGRLTRGETILPRTQSPTQPAIRDTLSTQTLQQLIGSLKDGTFKPGSKLPSQNELVEQFGISRTGVREALQMMAVLNLIEIRQGLGCFVKRVTPEYIVNADVLAILLEKEAILDVIETRKIVESGTAALATERGTAEDFWVMEDVLTQIDRTIQRGESVAVVGAEFHFAVAKATHNTVLARLVRSFTHLMAKAGELMETDAGNATVFKQHELISHRELYRIIRLGDPQKSRQAMIDHISYSEDLILDAFKNAEGMEGGLVDLISVSD